MYTEKRHQTWPNTVDLATKLWGTAEDLRRTAGFAATKDLMARSSNAEEEEVNCPRRTL